MTDNKRAADGDTEVHARKLQKVGDGAPTQPTQQQESADGQTQHAQQQDFSAAPTEPSGQCQASQSATMTAASAPAAGKQLHLLQPLRVQHAVSCDKGPRPTMEDVHVCVTANATEPEQSNRVWHFALYDGHGGLQCATFASQRLHEAVLAAGLLTQKDPSKSADTGSSHQASKAKDADGISRWQLDVKAAKQAIIKGFTSTDERLLQECSKHKWVDGATCVAVWLVGSTALVANIGDAKCVLARLPQTPVSEKGGSSNAGLRAVVLTKDHLAMYPAERARIDKAGGTVSTDGRLNGRIQVSRSFGDAQFKGSGSSATPDVTAFTVTPRERFMVCGCDGFWSVMDPQGAVEIVQQQLQQGKDPKAATNRLLNEAVVVRRCKDNCTVMLIVFELADVTDT